MRLRAFPLPWVIAAVGCVGVVALVVAASATPRPANVNTAGFSEARARRLVSELVRLGPRAIGSSAAARAADLIEAELRTIAGVEC